MDKERPSFVDLKDIPNISPLHVKLDEFLWRIIRGEYDQPEDRSKAFEEPQNPDLSRGNNIKQLVGNFPVEPSMAPWTSDAPIEHQTHQIRRIPVPFDMRQKTKPVRKKKWKQRVRRRDSVSSPRRDFKTDASSSEKKPTNYIPKYDLEQAFKSNGGFRDSVFRKGLENQKIKRSHLKRSRLIANTGVKRGSHLFEYGIQSHDPTNLVNPDYQMREKAERVRNDQNKAVKQERTREPDYSRIADGRDKRGEYDGRNTQRTKPQ
ncbi:unnamed protein product [Arabis nemorensis]|uniref:Uncharacterized protein n=1 Tax=Arabis nemorensis TaxID=586526 RepID=A0A565AU63_9BRAS|nr:unnamed protein product [Arabis nemorensis]